MGKYERADMVVKGAESQKQNYAIYLGQRKVPEKVIINCSSENVSNLAKEEEFKQILADSLRFNEGIEMLSLSGPFFVEPVKVVELPHQEALKLQRQIQGR